MSWNNLCPIHRPEEQMEIRKDTVSRPLGQLNEQYFSSLEILRQIYPELPEYL